MTIFNALHDYYKDELKVSYDIPDYSADIAKGDVEKAMKVLEFILYAAVNSKNKDKVIQIIESMDSTVQTELMNTIKKIENISSESIAQDTIESVYRKQFEELKGQFMELESTKNQLDSTVALYKDEISHLTEENQHLQLVVESLVYSSSFKGNRIEKRTGKQTK